MKMSELCNLRAHDMSNFVNADIEKEAKEVDEDNGHGGHGHDGHENGHAGHDHDCEEERLGTRHSSDGLLQVDT